MILIACVDDKMGLTFSGQRQSKDRILYSRIQNLVGARDIWISPYTSKALFPDDSQRPANWHISKIPARSAAPGELCFAEDLPSSEIHLADIHNDIEEVWLFRWNRAYPGTDHFPIDISSAVWKKVSSTELIGYSHPVILEEIWQKAAA